MSRRVNLADMLDGEPLDEPTEAAPRHPDIHLDVSEIAFNPENPREGIDTSDPEFLELKTSIAEIGIIAPLTVATAGAFLKHHPEHKTMVGTSRYVVVAGHRRLEAARLASLKRVPVIVNDAAAEDPLVFAVAENMLRVDLNPLQQARALRALTDKGVSQRKVAAGIGKTQAFVSQRIALLDLVPQLQEKVLSGELGVKGARAYATLPIEEQLTAYAADQQKASAPAPAAASPGPAVGDNPVITASAASAPAASSEPVTVSSDNPVITASAASAPAASSRPVTVSSDNPVIAEPTVPGGTSPVVVPEPRVEPTSTPATEPAASHFTVPLGDLDTLTDRLFAHLSSNELDELAQLITERLLESQPRG